MLHKNNLCESCLMPLVQDKGVRENEKYCSYCFKNGKLTYSGNDLKEFQKLVYAILIAQGKNKYVASIYTFMVRFAPRWRNANSRLA